MKPKTLQTHSVPEVDYGQLDTVGWTSVETGFKDHVALSNCLIATGNTISTPTHSRLSKIDLLRPTRANNARPNTLSAHFSDGSFPCHTDTAHWLTPARYLLLACLNPGDGARHTHLLDPRSMRIDRWEESLLYSEPFRVVNGRHSFFSSIRQRKREFIRFDPGCMKPMGNAGRQAMMLFGTDTNSDLLQLFRWKVGMMLVVDNWKLLHGRGSATSDDGDRTLLRLYVGGSS